MGIVGATIQIRHVQQEIVRGGKATGVRRSDLGITIQIQHVQRQDSTGLLRVDGVLSHRQHNATTTIIIKLAVKL